MSEPLIYLDHHATTPLDPHVLDVMQRVYRDSPGNPASTSHQAGHRSRRLVDESRQRIAECLNCQPREIIFTSGATEANNLAIKGVMGHGTPMRHMITVATEHRAVLDPARRLRRLGHQLTILDVDHAGRIFPEQMRDAVLPSTRLVSVMLANNEIGTIQRLPEVIAAIRSSDVCFHTDAAQAVGRIPVNLEQLPVDLMSFTAHKFYGPAGIGALFVRQSEDRRVPLTPQLDGGGHEHGLRSGTLPTALIVGFAEALWRAVQNLDQEMARLSLLRDQLWEMLQSAIPGIIRNGDPERSLPGNLNITIPGIDGEALLSQLQQSRLCISSGSACTSANPEPSHVLKAIGLSDQAAQASLRFGLGQGTTSDELRDAVTITSRSRAGSRLPSSLPE